MPRNSGPAKRDLFPSHGAGKGSAERSPGWREHYDDIDFGMKYAGPDHPDFTPISPGKVRKTYGATPKRLDADCSDWRAGVSIEQQDKEALVNYCETMRGEMQRPKEEFFEHVISESGGEVEPARTHTAFGQLPNHI